MSRQFVNRLSKAIPAFLFAVWVVILPFSHCAAAQTPTPSLAPATSTPQTAPSAKATAAPASDKIDKGWPRIFAAGKKSVSVYQPQVQSWKANVLNCNAAVVITDNSTKTPASDYGVISFTARTEVDKVNRTVSLSDFYLTKVSFPADPGKTDEYQALLEQSIQPKVRIIALDRLEADLDVTQAESAVAKFPLRNTPPQIIFSDIPAILVIVDGPAVMRPVEDQKNLMRVINTRALILFETDKRKYYLHLMDGWMEADENQIEGTCPEALPITPIRGGESLEARITCMRAVTATSTATTKAPGNFRRIPAAAGRISIAAHRSRICSGRSRIEISASSGPSIFSAAAALVEAASAEAAWAEASAAGVGNVELPKFARIVRTV